LRCSPGIEIDSGHALLIRIGNRVASLTNGLALPVYVDGKVHVDLCPTFNRCLYYAEINLVNGELRQSIPMPQTVYNGNRACTLTASVSAKEGYASLSADGKVFMFGGLLVLLL
jgi:hypothetical protein